MKQMKVIALLVVMTLLMVTGCQKQADEGVTIRIGTLKGPTGMGMVQLMAAAEDTVGQKPYSFEVLGSPDDMVGKILSGELDVAAVPTNMALLLYNRTEGDVILGAVNTLGVLYLVENGTSVDSMADLAGQDLYISGKGATPDFITQYLLSAEGLNQDRDVTINYSLEHADLATAMAAGDVTLGVLPEPHVTSALMRNPDLRVAMDLTQVFETVAETTLTMGAIVVQKAFAEAHPEALQAFFEAYAASVDFVNTEKEQASEWIVTYEILPNAALALRAIEPSNMVFLPAQDAKPALEAFYQILYGFEPKSIGGKLPDAGFYYQE